ncbi:MAG: radical SAM protein, partial [Anaerolineae bacterium]|nr:radical SAM protein [Anaerolineae bacterium]
LDQERTKEICLEIIARGLEVTWGCETRVDCVNPGLLRLMKQAGCKGIFYGIESLSDAALARVKKGFTYQQVRQAVAWTLEAGLTVDASFILGLPGETRESLRLIPEFIRETGLKDRIIINVLQILPGVEMCHQPERFGLTVPADDSSHWSDMRSYVEGIGTRDLLETAIEMRLAFHRNKYGDGLLFEVPVPEVEIMDEHLLT